MNNENYPTYTILSESKLRTKEKSSFLSKLSNWIRNFLENEE
ncbi:MAG: hypothetical protein ACPGUU_07200 [Flavobacteriaceae bacterium]